MFDQADAPLKVLQNPSLGDPLFVLGEIQGQIERVERVYLTDPRVEVLTRTVGDLLLRVQVLESQTPRAYLDRLRAYLVSTARRVWRVLWP